MKIDRRLLANLDWLTFSILFLLSLLGILTIYSATRPLMSTESSTFFIKQTYWLAIGLAALVLTISVDYVWLKRFSHVFFIVGLVLLVVVLLKGRTGLGAQRWINVGPIGFQPSEFFKLAFVIALARHLSTLRGKLNTKDILGTFSFYALVPLLLLFKQPDLGTTMVTLLLFLSLTFARGLEKKIFLFTVITLLISVPFVGNIFWDELKDYQKKRLVAFVDPEIDPAGMSYHINQSKVAIGSGGFLGRGYMKGTQGAFRFLPEKHTDFIFSVFAEEWGFLGSTVLLLLYLALILRGVDTAIKAKDEFGRFLALGIVFMFLIYCYINIAMTMGIMPVVGIPLPFVSYGGTALVSNFAAAGILINIRARRFELFY